MNTVVRSYSGLLAFETLEERFDYLRLNGKVALDTFGHERYLNQRFYTSNEWKSVRRAVITRDYGNELGVEGFPIRGPITIHHIEPLTPYDLKNTTDKVISLENLISVSAQTHRAIHYGDRSLLPTPYIERKEGDTKLW